MSIYGIDNLIRKIIEKPAGQKKKEKLLKTKRIKNASLMIKYIYLGQRRGNKRKRYGNEKSKKK